MKQKKTRCLKKECVEVTRDALIVIKDKGSARKATFRNASRDEYEKIRVDGCMILQKKSADFVLSVIGKGELIIELKGKNTDEAIDQIFETADFWCRNGLQIADLAALVVGTRRPRFNTTVQIAKDRFAKKFRGPLHIETRDGEFVFSEVLKFNGKRIV